MKQREERKQKRLARKERKRVRQEKRKAKKGKHEHCDADAKMNCFSHDNDHWKTPPFWTQGPFCACTNSNNNTTHNYLYCEFVTGTVMYFDLTVDPHQLRNVLHTLSDEEMNHMHEQVVELREYSAKTEYLKEEDKRRKEAASARRKISQKRLEKLQRKPEERRKEGRRRRLPEEKSLKKGWKSFR